MSLSIPLQYLRKLKCSYSVKIHHHDQFLNDLHSVDDGTPQDSEEMPDSHILCSHICRSICAEISLDFVS